MPNQVELGPYACSGASKVEGAGYSTADVCVDSGVRHATAQGSVSAAGADGWWTIAPSGGGGVQLTFTSVGTGVAKVYACSNAVCAALSQIGDSVSGSTLARVFRSAPEPLRVHFESLVARNGWAASWAPVALGVCGNGLRDVGEACDDGDSASGDGCSATCAIEASFACSGGSATAGPDSCARLYTGQTGQIQQTSYGSNAALSWLIAPPGAHSLQLVFSAFDLANDFVSMSSCVDAGCRKLEQVGLRLTGGVARSVRTSTGFAMIRLTSDSATNGAGFTVAWEAVGQRQCGNRFREPGEECDDGNLIPGDGCSASCVVETLWSCMGASERHGPDACARLTTAQGTLTDGSGEENYTASSEFWWVLSPQGLAQVQLSLVALDVHQSDTLQVLSIPIVELRTLANPESRALLR